VYDTSCPAWGTKTKSCALQGLFLMLKGREYTSSAPVGESTSTAPTLQDALKGYLNLLDISPDLETITTIKFTDQWEKINMILKSFGYTWSGEVGKKKWSKSIKSQSSQQPQTPDIENLIKEEMAKSAGLLTREAAEYMVRDRLAKETTQPTSQEKGKKLFIACKDVVDGMKSFKVHGKLLDDPTEVDLNTKKGPMTVVKTRLDDGTSQLRITFWNPKKVPILKAGDEITVDGLLGSAPYDGLPQASGGDYVKIIFEK